MSVTDASLAETTNKTESGKLGAARAFMEVVVVSLCFIAGLMAGGATGWLPMGPILGVAFPLVAATLFLRRENKGWPAVGFPRRMSFWKFLAYTFAALFITILVNGIVVGPLLNALNAPPTDVSVLINSIEGNTLNYVVFMVFIVWGSAGIGEELIARGFILNRFTNIFGPATAVVAQAAMFGLAHSYQGISGMVMIFVLGLIFGSLFLRCGRNLWPLIVAHGIMDTIGITAIYLGYGEAMVGG